VKAVGFRERFFPFFCAILPVAVNELGGEAAAGARKIAATSCLFLGNAIGVWALVYLRRSFSIMAEVRELVARGPYRFVRHPMYLGQILSTGGLLLLAPSWPSALLYAVFVAAQLARAGFEEAKLALSLPEYEAYRKRTGAYWPRP
jgi:protein-S-isoprenylcysteine O-methyltransferase Ste14